ncbi:Uncharacterized protein PECH_002976 [Penicillium ucsense]|uniref:Uncharacterized protein n=1 Tax=Penicillium ucsense TaxID=2839758 RepID=A0A8J8W658_9EURO|nr:Uncharacterized protein PECM_003912 [Penicillium ucsense]KAF7737797.1 Uncharacterized protein PECH_002976 [Penicillium ucsense]
MSSNKHPSSTAGDPRAMCDGKPLSKRPRVGRLTSDVSDSDANAPPPGNPHKKQKKILETDPNMSNSRLLVNRACIYERNLPGDAYITAHVARLQHGYYASKAVSDNDAEYVDFLAISFVFHTSRTLQHRFKSATIKASIRSAHGKGRLRRNRHGSPPVNPHFLMHAPHLIYGHVSPETMEWTFSLAGALGVSETPVSASIMPSHKTTGRYRRYEMMRIQGSARTLKSTRGAQLDVEAGEIVWSLEENSLQRTGLPREFTFVMLVQKPSATSALSLDLEIEPVVQAMVGKYPSWLLGLSTYQPLPRRGVDFNQEIGQRFEPVDASRGFNFAALESSIDDYIAMPGRKYTRQIEYPDETSPEPNQDHDQSDNHDHDHDHDHNHTCTHCTLNPLQQLHFNGMVLQNHMLQSHVNQLYAAQPQLLTSTQMPRLFDLHHDPHNATISIMASQAILPSSRHENSDALRSSYTGASHHDERESRFQSYENIRASMLRAVHPEDRCSKLDPSLSAKGRAREAPEMDGGKDG